MKPIDFDYVAPATVPEAIALLRQHGDEAKVLAGGQSLMPLLNMRLARPRLLVDIGRIPGLAGVDQDRGTLRIGALTRHRTLERSELVTTRLPLLAAAVQQIGHVQIRNRGTLGGSMAHADPAAELPLVALTLDAEFELTGADGPRTVPAAAFFTGLLSTAVAADELLTAVRFPLWQGVCGWSFQEVARRHGDFALVAVAVQLQLDADGDISRVGIGLGGVGPQVLRAPTVEGALLGQPATPAVLAAAATRIGGDIDPDGDLHASAEYRRAVAELLVGRALTAAVARGRPAAGGEAQPPDRNGEVDG